MKLYIYLSVHCLHRLISIQMPVSVGKHIQTITLPVCVCVYVRKTPEAGSLVVSSTRQYRLLLKKYGLSMRLLENWTLGYAHTHRVIA